MFVWYAYLFGPVDEDMYLRKIQMCVCVSAADGPTDEQGESQHHVMTIARNAMEAFGDKGCDR